MVAPQQFPLAILMTTRKGDLSHFQFSSFSLLEYKGLIGDGSHGDGDVRRIQGPRAIGDGDA